MEQKFHFLPKNGSVIKNFEYFESDEMVELEREITRWLRNV